MSGLKVSEDIVPMSEFKARAKEWLGRVARSGAPVVITQNGRAAGVLLSPRAYDLLTERARFVEAVGEGLTDANAGRVTPHEEIVAELAERFGDTPSR
ncbi:MAG: type II toxin-antitoxin system Phd/YefM family antitoxin [Polyangia bacterium]